MQTRSNLNDNFFGKNAPLVLIAGPCVIEDEIRTSNIANHLKKITDALEIPFIFKASFDKANRTSIHSYRGPGLVEGLRILEKIKSDLKVPILTDVHDVSQVEQVASIVDVIQIPAFLCRQTDLLMAVAHSGITVNIKKGQFLSPWDVPHLVEKVTASGNQRIVITERGVSFGYNNLVVDMRSIPIMQATGYPVIFDATHSVQLPGGAGSSSGGQRQYAPVLARAAVAAGANGIFIEVHPEPDKALCDGPNSLPLEGLDTLLTQLKALRQIINSGEDTP